MDRGHDDTHGPGHASDDFERSLLTAVFILAASPAAEAQPTRKIYRVGYLALGSRPVLPHPVLEGFREGLRELGWVEGQNIIIEYRFAEGRLDRLPDLAAELVRLKVDVIVGGPRPPVVAAKNATRTIPIVMMAVGDPVGTGLVASLARPGGNITGLSYSVRMDTIGKGLSLLKEAVPKVRRVAILSHPDSPSAAVAIRDVEAADVGCSCPASHSNGPGLGLLAPAAERGVRRQRRHHDGQAYGQRRHRG